MKYRKDIRLKNYDYKTNGYYFVTICTAKRRPWLEQYKTEVETLLKDMPKRFSGVIIDFYSIASNHLHVIFVLNNAKARLGDIVRTFKALVTKSTGCKPFWEWNYYEHIIRDEKALYNIRKYIRENPLKERIDWKHIYGGINATATTHSSGAIYRTNQGGAIYRTLEGAKGVALIIVIFAMMLFAVLGWTLANLQSGDFEINLRNLDSERALGLAEAGTNWALQQLSLNSCWRTISGVGDNNGCGLVNSDCDAPDDWLSIPHSLSPGQYNLCCRNPDPAAGETGNVVIESRGYVASQANYRAMRQVKVEVSLANAVMAQPADPDVANKGLLNWWPARQNHTIQIEGNVYTGHYDGDGNAAYDEAGQDYDDQPAPILPQDNLSPSDERRNFTATYPSINMTWLYNNTVAGNRWPSPSNRDIEATALATSGGSTLNVDQGGFFNGMQNMAVRNLGPGHGTWNDGDWAVINSVPAGYNYTRANLDKTIGDDWDNDTVKLVRRVYNNVFNDDLRYTGGLASGEVGAMSADLLIDVRTSNVEFRNTYHICEGDIAVKGINELLIRFTGTGMRYPTLATQYGNIISTEPLETLLPSLTESQRQDRRQIAGLIYSEFGLVNLNYLRPPDTGSTSFRGNLVYGYRITLDGGITIWYRPDLVTSSNGFIFAPATVKWREQ